MRKKRKSNVLIGILCFFLGFLFAFIFQIGVIAGGGWFIATRDIDKMMEFIGLPNTDENGNHRYINTDEESGGAKTIKDLIINVVEAVNDMSTLSIGKLTNMVPVADGLLDMVFDMTGKYIEIDREEFASTSVTELPQFIVDSVMNIRGSAIMGFIPEDSGAGSNGILKALLNGAEAEYATLSSGTSGYASGGRAMSFPVLYDVYTESGGIYTREWPAADGQTAYPTYAGGTKLPTDWLQSEGVEKDGDLEIEKFRLYFVPCRVTESGISEATYSTDTFEYTASDNRTKKSYKVLTFGEDTDFIVVKPDGDGNYVLNHGDIWAAKNDSATNSSDRFTGYSYKNEYARSYYYVQETRTTGGGITLRFKTVSGLNYFYNHAGEMMDLRVHTLADIMDDPYEPLESVSVASVTGGNSDLINKMFGKTSIADLLNGKVDFNKLIDDMELSEFINNVSPENKLMTNLVYKLSDVRDNGDGSFSAIYDIDGERKEAYVTVKNGSVDKVYLADDRKTVLPGSKIRELSDTSNNVRIDKIVDIGVNDAIMRYLGYGITDVVAAEGDLPYEDENNVAQTHHYKYKGVYNLSKVMEDDLNKKTCYINVRIQDGKEVIDGVWYYLDEELEEVPATALNDITGRISDIMNYLTLPDVIKVNPTQSIMAYVAYGVTGVQKAEGEGYSYTAKYTPAGSGTPVDCYISVSSGDDPGDTADYVNKIWYYADGEPVYVFGTKISKVAGKAESLKEELTLGEIINIKDDDEKILLSIRDTKINGLNERITSLTLGEIVSEESLEKSPLLRHLQDTPVTGIAAAVDELLVQEIYSNEVYGLPFDGDPMEVVRFDESNGYVYYEVTEDEESVSDGNGDFITKRVKRFTLANGDGTLTGAQFAARGHKCYYTYCKTTPGADEGESIKIVGYGVGWLYYVMDEETGKFKLTEENGSADDTIGNLTAEQIAAAEEGKYYSYGETQGMWRLVLYKKVVIEGETLLIEKAYTMNNFNNMVAVCATNVYSATLKELHDAGVITADLSGKTFHYTAAGVPQSVVLEDITLKELIDIVLGMSTSS